MLTTGAEIHSELRGDEARIFSKCRGFAMHFVPFWQNQGGHVPHDLGSWSGPNSEGLRHPKKPLLQKEKRGFSSQKTATDNCVSVITWKDNKVAFFTTNCSSRVPEVPVGRYCRDAKQRVLVNQPRCINQYNKSMGVVDRADQNVSSYRICIRSKRWWWVALFAWVPDVMLQNACIFYRKYKTSSNPKHDLLSFRREVVSVYLTQYSRNNSNIGDPCIVNFSRRVSNSVRLDKQGHYSEACQTTKRCGLCHKTTRKWCPKCKKGVHDHCFNTFHGFCAWLWEDNSWSCSRKQACSFENNANSFFVQILPQPPHV